MMDEGELEKRIKEAFWKTFHKSGELWFDYLGTEEECNEATESFWMDFYENLQMKDIKKEFESILSADMPDFQKLLAVSAFKNETFGEK